MSSAKNKENYGRGFVELSADSLDFLDTPAVVARLQATFSAPTYSPPRLPESALKLLEMSRNPEVDLRDVGKLLANDQMLAAEVLRIAQSAQYSGNTGSPVRTLDEALGRLGMKRTTELFLQASMNMRVFRVRGYQKYMDKLRVHSAMVAQVARLVSRQTALYDEHAFLCGLLHDVGIAAALIAFADATPRGQEPPAFAQIWPAIRDAHGAAGGILAKLWQLPPEVAFVIEHHHDFIVGGYPHPTGATIELANYFCEKVNAGFGQETNFDSVKKALKSLNFTEADATRIEAEVVKLAEQTA